MTKILKRLLFPVLTCGVFVELSVPAMAIPIIGTATWTGVFTLTSGSPPTGFTANTLSFCPPTTPTQNPCPSVSAGVPGWNVVGSGSGDLAPYGSDPAGGTITSLSQATNPVGVTLVTPTLFVTFAPSPGVGDISFYMQTVFAGVGDPTCSSLTCTPPGSSVTFLDGTGGNSSATITMEGFARHASDGPGFATATPLQMVFTAQFNSPYATVLSNFQSAGTLTSTYSATFAAQAVPEPMTISLVGFGLLGLGIMSRRFVKR